MPRGGAVVNISSIAGKVPLPWLTLYSASKYALNAYSDGLRMELCSAGIHVLCVCPGYVDTSFSANVLLGKIPEKVAGQRRFKITAEKCAEEVLEGLRRDKRTVVTPRIGWLLVAAARLIPGVIHARMAGMRSEAGAAARSDAL
jgi:short-subunit dehydrogenase